MNLEEIERNVASFKSHFGRGQLAVSYFFFALTAAQRLLCAAAIRCRAPALMRRGPRFSLEAAFDELDTVRWPEPLPAFFRTAQRLFCAAEILALASSLIRLRPLLRVAPLIPAMSEAASTFLASLKRPISRSSWRTSSCLFIEAEV